MPLLSFNSTTLLFKPVGLPCGLYLLLLLFIALRCNHNPASSIGYAEVILIPENGAISPVGAITVPIGSVIAPTVIPFDGSPFAAWKIAGNIEIFGSTDNQASTFRIKGNGSITATFRSTNQFPIDIVPPPNATITKSPEKPFYQKGDVVTFTFNPPVGYRLNSWTGGTSGSVNPTTVTITGPTTISATMGEIPGKPGVTYVWIGLTTGNHSGSNWVNAMSDLNSAVSTADAVVWVRCGEYTPSTQILPAARAKIYGGFTGFENQYQDVNNRDFYKHFTIIKGTNTPIIMKLTGGSNTISGFVFTGALTCAVWVESSSNSIEDCVIRDINGNLTKAVNLMPLGGVPITDNSIQRSVFHSNTGTNVTAGKAIHINLQAFNTRILNSIFYKNSGPAINNSNTTTVDAEKTSIIGCTIFDNGLPTWAASGGIRNSSGLTFLQGSILWANKSSLTAGSQIDVADWVEDCDVQDHTGTGVATKKRWQEDGPSGNQMVDPVLNSVQILADGAWFAPSASHVFLPGAAALHNANFTPRPAHDVRKILRVGNFYNMGAYEE